MTQVLIERAENAHLLIIQDNATGKRKVIAIPFNGGAPEFQPESDAVKLLTGLTVD